MLQQPTSPYIAKPARQPWKSFAISPEFPMVSQIVRSSFAAASVFTTSLIFPAHPETACANTFAASSLSSFALSACGNS